MDRASRGSGDVLLSSILLAAERRKVNDEPWTGRRGAIRGLYDVATGRIPSR